MVCVYLNVVSIEASVVALDNTRLTAIRAPCTTTYTLELYTHTHST